MSAFFDDFFRWGPPVWMAQEMLYLAARAGNEDQLMLQCSTVRVFDCNVQWEQHSFHCWEMTRNEIKVAWCCMSPFQIGSRERCTHTSCSVVAACTVPLENLHTSSKLLPASTSTRGFFLPHTQPMKPVHGMHITWSLITFHQVLNHHYYYILLSITVHITYLLHSITLNQKSWNTSHILAMSYYYYISITIDSVKFEIMDWLSTIIQQFGDFLNMPQPLSHILIYEFLKLRQVLVRQHLSDGLIKSQISMVRINISMWFHDQIRKKQNMEEDSMSKSKSAFF